MAIPVTDSTAAIAAELLRGDTMSKHLLTDAGGYDRRAIMRNAHKRFRDGRRLALDWTFAQCLKTAWAAARIQCQSDTRATMSMIADIIEADIAHRITLAPAIPASNRLSICSSFLSPDSLQKMTKAT